ncbi:MAG: C-terminal binding protein [Candidatus Rokuibacteriota bacterium]
MSENAWRVTVFGGLLDETTAAERARLEAAGVTVVVRPREIHEEQIVAAGADADVLMVLAQMPFPGRVLDRLPRLLLHHQCTVGYDQVDVAAATRLGILVTNSPLFCLEEVSDHAAMLILACARNLPQQLHAMARHGWDRPHAVAGMGPTHRMRGKTLGFVGFGRIARRTAEKLQGFGMRYLAYDPYLTPADVTAWHAELVDLGALCRQADFVSLHALLNDGTRRMFGEAQFRAMKRTAYIVNTSRGGTVDEAAMARALREGWIAGAGLDVLEEEPPAADNPLLRLPNVLLTPHTAGHGVESMGDNRQQSIDEVVRFLGGEWPRTIVNPEVKPHARARARMQATPHRQPAG